MHKIVNGVEIEMTEDEVAAHLALQASERGDALHVKMEAQRRIESRYPLTRQMNIMRAGTPAEQAAMGAFVDAIRTASDALEQHEGGIPANYTNDQYWPAGDIASAAASGTALEARKAESLREAIRRDIAMGKTDDAILKMMELLE